MTALVLADFDDIHWDGGRGKADLLISCGDVDDNLIAEVSEAYKCQTVIAVRGNHDRSAHFAQSIIDLHLNKVEIKGVSFGGFQGSWKYKPRGNYLYEQDEVEEALKDFPRVDVFVAHNSPRRLHDKEDGPHYGFEAFNTYIKLRRPKIFIHGHQHIRRQTKVEETVVIGAYGVQVMQLL